MSIAIQEKIMGATLVWAVVATAVVWTNPSVLFG